jgi:hypothetical protein
MFVLTELASLQGDQIGRIFAFWAKYFSGHFEKIQNKHIILGYFFRG